MDQTQRYAPRCAAKVMNLDAGIFPNLAAILAAHEQGVHGKKADRNNDRY